MSELAYRGYNVAIPEIDKGDDVFVVNDETGSMWRIQVKTSKPKTQQTSLRFQYRVRDSAIQRATTPELYFVFVMRTKDRWRFLVIERAVLRNYVIAHKLGSPNGEHRQIVVVVHENNTVTCNKIDVTHHMEEWTTWPLLTEATDEDET